MRTPTAGGLAAVTVDSSLMYPTTARRFLMTLWEMEGLKIELVPRAVQEMYSYVRESEGDQWYRHLRGETQRTGMTWAPETVERIVEVAASAAAKWVNTELGYGNKAGRNDSMLHAVTLSAEQSVEAATIATAIPRDCFRGPTKNDYRGDREIVAQGVVSGFKILASDNRGSIVRNRMNGWLSEAGHASDEFVLNADDAIEKAGPWRSQPAHMLEAVLRAALPSEPRSAKRVAEIVDTFIERMRSQGLRGVALSCLDAWHGPSQKLIYDTARAHIERGANQAGRRPSDVTLRRLRYSRTAIGPTLRPPIRCRCKCMTSCPPSRLQLMTRR